MSDICLYLLAGLSHDVTGPVQIPGHAFLDTTQVAVHLLYILAATVQASTVQDTL